MAEKTKSHEGSDGEMTMAACGGFCFRWILIYHYYIY
jgi:hypothetical protein